MIASPLVLHLPLFSELMIAPSTKAVYASITCPGRYTFQSVESVSGELTYKTQNNLPVLNNIDKDALSRCQSLLSLLKKAFMVKSDGSVLVTIKKFAELPTTCPSLRQIDHMK